MSKVSFILFIPCVTVAVYIPLVSNEGKAGLGAGAVPPPVFANPAISRTLGPATMRLAAKTNMLKPPAKAFASTDYDSD